MKSSQLSPVALLLAATIAQGQYRSAPSDGRPAPTLVGATSPGSNAAQWGPVLGHSGHCGTPDPNEVGANPVEVSHLADQVDSALGELALSTETKPLSIHDFAFLGEILGQYFESSQPELPTNQQIRSQFEAHVAFLMERAQMAALQAAELYELQEALIDARLERLMGALSKRAQSGGWTREEYLEVSSLLERRAQLASLNGSSSFAQEVRAGLQAAVDRVYGRAVNAAEDIRDLHVLYLRARVQRAIQLLTANARRMGLDAQQFQRVKAFIIGRGQSAAQSLLN